jgi:hypothetical protein
MTIRIQHHAGVGEWANGTVVELDDRRALRLIHDGYAVEVVAEPKPQRKKKETPWPSH